MKADSMEILAPAGTMENFLVALDAGADAIYLGGKLFNARANAGNFSEEELGEAVRLAHLRSVSVYVTVNIVMSDQELKALSAYLQTLERLGVDAIIVQDLAVAQLAQRVAPRLHIHGSTQMTASNLDTVLFLEEQGFHRVVLSRELSLEEIKYICANSRAEIEVFVHGALCISYSGQCLMSSFIGCRSGNRGACAQPCRLPYELVDGRGKVIGETGYLMSPKDLNYSSFLKELADAGVRSCKVEGRMKQPSYVREVIGTYRELIDGAPLTKEREERLALAFNRGFSAAYLEGKEGRAMMTENSNNEKGAKRSRAEEGPSLSGEKDLQDKLPLYIDLYGDVGQNAFATVALEDGAVLMVGSDYVCKEADQNPTSVERCNQQLGRLGNTSFYLAGLNIPEAPLLWPASVLNALRRDAVAAAEEHLLEAHKEHMDTLRRDIEADVRKRCHREGRKADLHLPNLTKKLVESSMKENGYGADRHVVSSRADTAHNPMRSTSNADIQVGGRGQRQTANTLGPKIYVHVDEWEEMLAAVDVGADAIVFGGDHLYRLPLGLDMYEKVSAYCKDRGVKLCLPTARVLRDRDREDNHRRLDAMVAAQPDAIGIHCVGTLRALDQRSFTGEIWAEASLQTFNSKAVDCLKAWGCTEILLSQECTDGQIRSMVRQTDLPLSYIVEGRTELMISEHCPICAQIGGGRKDTCTRPCLKGQYGLRDRKGQVFPLRTDPHCRLHLMNSQPLSLLPYSQSLYSMGLHSIRIDGRQEGAQWIAERLKAYKEAFTRGEKIKGSPDTTRGHFKRGVLA